MLPMETGFGVAARFDVVAVGGGGDGEAGAVVDCELVEVRAWDVEDVVESEVDEVDDEIEKTEDELNSARLELTHKRHRLDEMRCCDCRHCALVVGLRGSTQTGPSAT